MATLAETQRLFLEGLPEAEEALSSQEGPAREGHWLRVPTQKGQRRTVLVGLALAGLACVGLLAWPRAPAAASTRVVGLQGKAEAKDLVPAFGRCGGQGWHNSTCCEKGCACVVETEYYSQCKAPEGLEECNYERAKVEEEAAKVRVEDRQVELDELEDALEVAKKEHQEAIRAHAEAQKAAEKTDSVAATAHSHLHAAELEAGKARHEVENKANKELDKALQEARDTLAEQTQTATELRDSKLKAAKDAHDKAEANKKAKREASEAASKAYHDVVKKHEEAKAYVDKYDEEEKVRKEKNCPGLFGACTATNCCALGCKPFWQNSYFCQCEGPNREKYCLAQEMSDKYGKFSAALPNLTRDMKKLKEANETAANESETADEHFTEVAKKAEQDEDAAKEEFKVSTKKPQGEADKKIDAAKAKADKLLQAAKEKFLKETATERAAYDKAKAAKDANDKTLEERQHAMTKAEKNEEFSIKDIAQAKQALTSAKSAVGSWHRAASGNFCAE